MKALMGILIGYSIAILAGRKMRNPNYVLYGFLTLIALLTASFMIGYMFFAKKPVP